MKEGQNEYYLKPNVALEALVDQWYGWGHLVSPATAGLNIKNRHLKIMKSYIQNPKIHAAAIKKPEMRGGPFIDYDGGRVAEIKELYDNTIESRKNMLDLADAIFELNNLLQNEAKGFSLDSMYEKVPTILKGFVELYYDLNDQPNFRFFEAFLYNSEFYDESAQSVSMQLVTADDARSFVLSTPRLYEPEVVNCKVPFSDKLIDEMFRMQEVPGNYETLLEHFKVSEDQKEVFKNFFTKTPPAKYEGYKGDGIRTRYFGHACVLVETSEISILVDPVISYDGYENDVSRYTSLDLPEKIDYVLITHNHQDHVLLESLLQMRHKIGTIIIPGCGKGGLQDPSLRLMFNAIGFDNVIELDEMESLKLDKCTITGLPFLGEHSDLDIRSKLCYHVSLHNRFRVVFVADSQNVEPEVYKKAHALLGDIDVLFLGMECDGAPGSWLYGPLMESKMDRGKDQSRRLRGSDSSEGFGLVELFNAKEVFVYAMGLEPWLEFISSIKYTDESKPIIESNTLIDKCISKGINAERLFGEKTIEY
jgi:L-ascorbate metabolism protein UlaG (beta-lactamase superfamily)